MEYFEVSNRHFNYFALISFRSYGGILNYVRIVFLPIGFGKSPKLCFRFFAARLCFPSPYLKKFNFNRIKHLM